METAPMKHMVKPMTMLPSHEDADGCGGMADDFERAEVSLLKPSSLQASFTAEVTDTD